MVLKKQEYRIEGDIVILDISSPKYPEAKTIIDLEDWNRIKDMGKWTIDSNGYAQTSYNSKFYRLHRFIMNAKKGDYIDHINHNILDNRKINLRICTNQQNSFNARKPKGNLSSKYKGVHFHKKAKKWQAQAKLNYEYIYIGLFNTEKEAAQAYNEFAKKNHGEFACLNEIS